jgi:hypothetical protein
MSAYHQRSGSPLRVAGLSLLAITLLYGGSFYTRDWRLAVHQAEQPLAEQPIRPSRGAMRPVAIEAMPTQLPARVATQAAHAEPEVTGAVSRSPEPVVGPPTAPLAAATPSGQGGSLSAATAAPAPVPSRQATPSSEASPPRVEVQATPRQPAAQPTRVRHARLLTERAARRPRVRYAHLRTQPGAWRQASRVRVPRTTVVSQEPASPFSQLFQFFNPGAAR